MQRTEKNRKKKKLKIIFFSVLGLSLIISGFFVYLVSQINHVEIDKSDEALGISKPSMDEKENNQKEGVPSYEKFDNQIINIALFGVDRRDTNERGRSDSTMILTVDFKNNKLKLSSLMRDMYVSVDGYGKTKFNHAYAYGGAPLAIKTINQTFDTNIRDYVSVDFFTLERIIDAIGGVEIDVKEEEYPLLNKYMNEVAKIQNDNMKELDHAGLQTLDGKQAVAYARIRYVGNGDFERTERQRTVLTQMVKKVEGLSKTELPALVMKILPYVETSLDKNTILDLGMKYLTEGINTMEQDRFPRDGYWESKTINGGWYMDFNQEETINQLHDFMYEPVSSEKIQEIETNTGNQLIK